MLWCFNPLLHSPVVLYLSCTVELGTVHKGWPYQCCKEGKVHLPWPAGSKLSNAAQWTVNLACHKCTLLGFMSTGIPRSPSVQLLFRQVAPSIYWYMELFLPACRPVSPAPPNFVVSKLAEDTFSPVVQVINEDTEQCWTQYWPMECAASYWPPARFHATCHNLLGPVIWVFSFFSLPHNVIDSKPTNTFPFAV